MKETTRIQNYQVEIHRRARQRSMKLRVRDDGSLQVNCNRSMPLRSIAQFVNESEAFIQKRILELEKKRKDHPPKRLVAGETILFFGRALPLELTLSWNKRAQVNVLENSLELKAPADSSLEERQLALRRFFKKQAALHLNERVAHYAREMQLFPKSLSLRGQRTRWGSCSSRGEISLNWKLLAAPPWVIDYVVVHELAHLRHMNHSAAFWSLVEHSFCETPSAKHWLRLNAFEIGQQFADGT